MRRWLIRTTNNIILGPISEKKLKLLIKKGSLESNDEICSGNGYWISLKEKDLVNKYLYRGVMQGFNPIYHESDDETAEASDELEITDHNNEAIQPVEDDATTTIKQEELDKLIASSQVSSPSANMLTGLVLKISIGLLVLLALGLLYFRNSILSGVFSQ